MEIADPCSPRNWVSALVRFVRAVRASRGGASCEEGKWDEGWGIGAVCWRRWM